MTETQKKEVTKKARWAMYGMIVGAILASLGIFGFVKDNVIKPNLDAAYTTKAEHKALTKKLDKIDKRVLVIETHYQDIKGMFRQLLRKKQRR